MSDEKVVIEMTINPANNKEVLTHVSFQGFKEQPKQDHTLVIAAMSLLSSEYIAVVEAAKRLN